MGGVPAGPAPGAGRCVTVLRFDPGGGEGPHRACPAACAVGPAQFLAGSAGVELGTVAGMPDLNRGGATDFVVVAPEARGTGVPDLLVRAVIEWAARGGHRVVGVEVAEGNMFAEQLYRRNGFALTGVSGPLAPGHDGNT
ncbi:GNAT family N-acetyltransferase [Nocardia sp. NPDC023852]|uniref:GNAT family N-acetyltransferase n=1 Tax=Nocardia sp. NPDC023852 TaxID=3154697 RepID=UPI0033F1B71B